jgi:DNA-binding response OmpR family regulator
MNKKILVIEDEASLLKVLNTKISSEGFEVLQARNGEEGLKLALKEHPDLILLDIVMPKMDGMTMLEKMKEDKWGKDAKVIILSNLSEAEKTADILNANIKDFLVKSDWSINDLMKKIKKELKV